METLRRDLHESTAAISALLTRFSKLAAQASTSYASSGSLKEDVGRRKEELEGEINEALETVRPPYPSPRPQSAADARDNLQFMGQIERLASFYVTAHPPPSASALHALERHREVHSEYVRDYKRTKVSWTIMLVRTCADVIAGESE